MKYIRNISMCVALTCSGMSQAVYERMLKAVSNGCDAAWISVDPSSVTADFEVAAMNAVRTTFGIIHVAVHGRFFHLCQSTWRKIQELGLQLQSYRQQDDVKQFCGMLDSLSLAFLQEDEIIDGMESV